MTYKEKLLFFSTTLNKIIFHYIPNCFFVDIVGIDEIINNWTEDECEKVFKQIWNNINNVKLFYKNEFLPDILSTNIQPFCIYNDITKEENLCDECIMKDNCHKIYYEYLNVIKSGDVKKICDYFFIKSLLTLIRYEGIEFEVDKLMTLIKNEIEDYLDNWVYSLNLLSIYDFNNMLKNIHNTCFDFKEIIMSIVNYKLNRKKQELEKIFGKTIRFNNE